MEGIGSLLKGQLPEGLAHGCDIPTDPKEREQQKADMYNASTGNLNEEDGYNCDICKNKGFVAVVTQNEQNAILQRTINQLALKGNIGEMNQLKQAGPDAPELQYGAYSLARKKALQLAFERMVADGIEIRDYIKLD